MDRDVAADGGSGIYPAHQSRSQAMQDRLLEAGKVVFSSLSYDEMRVQDVVAEAGCSTGSFYRRFKDKDSFFLALQRSIVARNIANIDNFFDRDGHSDETAFDVLERYIQGTCRIMVRQRGFWRALFQRSMRGDNVLDEMSRLDMHARGRWVGFLGDRGILDRADPEFRVYLTLRVINGALAHLILNPSKRLDPKDTRVVREMALMGAAYLKLPLPDQDQDQDSETNVAKGKGGSRSPSTEQNPGKKRR